MNPVVYLTCELKSRDFESRLLIAKCLLQSGFAVVVGQQWSMSTNAKTAMAGCYLFKTVNKIMAGYIAKSRSAGHLIVSTDEESLPFCGDGFLSNIDSGAIEMTDLFLALNEEQRHIMLRQFPKLRVETTGNARVDLIATARYQRPLSEPYILFNTSFALTNSVRGSVEDAVEVLIRGGLDSKTQAGQQELQMRLGFEQHTRQDMMALINWAAQSLPIKTVVRPHPAENNVMWTEVMPSKIKVVVGENPLPWISGAMLVVHANSTTGLESAILQRPCINLSPSEFDAWTKQFVMRRVNRTVDSAQAAIALIARFFENSETLAPMFVKEQFPSHAADKIAQAVIELMRARGVEPTLNGNFPWQQLQRSNVQRAKFSASKDEFIAGMYNIAPDLAVRTIELDDSVVLMIPA